MFILFLGVALWWAAHLWKRIAPASRKSMGQSGKALVTAGLVAAIVLMVIGYRGADGAFFWGPSAAMKGINNLLMLVSVYLFAASGMQTGLARRMRHPMLAGMLVWAVAHLLPNGDVPSFLLFGGLGLWAIVEMGAINRAVPKWTPPAPVPARKEAMAVVGTLVVFGAISLIHIWLGYNPFGA